MLEIENTPAGSYTNANRNVNFNFLIQFRLKCKVQLKSGNSRNRLRVDSAAIGNKSTLGKFKQFLELKAFLPSKNPVLFQSISEELFCNET